MIEVRRGLAASLIPRQAEQYITMEKVFNAAEQHAEITMTLTPAKNIGYPAAKRMAKTDTHGVLQNRYILMKKFAKNTGRQLDVSPRE